MNKRLRSESLWHGLAMAIVNDGVVDNEEIALLYKLLNQYKDTKPGAVQDLKELVKQICSDEIVTSKERQQLLRFLQGFVSSLTPNEKGDAFEEYLITCFSKSEYRLIEWRSDKHIPNGMYPASSQWPDIVVEHKATGKRIAIECKYRATSRNGEVKWARSPDQVHNYKEYEKREKIPVFVAIGLGGEPDSPRSLYIVRLRYLKEPTITMKNLERFRIDSQVVELDPND